MTSSQFVLAKQLRLARSLASSADAGSLVKLQIDLAAESAIAAERDSEKIAVEIKSFIGDSDISSFHTALGQYLKALLD